MNRIVKLSACMPLLALVLVCTVQGYAQPPVAGRWEGAINLPGMDLGINVNFMPAGDSLRGTIDIPMQMAKGLTLHDIKTGGDTVRFSLQAGPGIARFEGVHTGDSISGTFAQATVRCPFMLRRAKVLPQPVPPPYRQEEVRVTADSVVLEGTLTIPPSPGPHPAAILLTGSGPQNRDEEIFGFPIFAQLADHLTRNGFAVLRCDDRGVGGSTGSYAAATTQDFAADALAQWSFLRERRDIQISQVGFIGHSEGALAAAIACRLQPAVAFAVLLAGPSVRGDSLILGQVERLVRSSGATEAEVQRALHSQERVFETVRADTGWSSLRVMLIAELQRGVERATPEQRKAFGNIDSMASARVDIQMSALRLPWFRRFILYDPAEDLKSITCPVLALYGSLDMQVPPAQNYAVMETIFRESGNREAICKVIPGANHLFQAAKTGSPMEYGQLEKEFAPGVLETLSGWMAGVRGRR